MMKFIKYIGLGLLPIFLLNISFAQIGITAYHLKGKVVQNIFYNPAENSDSKVNIALPINVGISVSNFASFNDVLTLNESGYLLSGENLLSAVTKNDIIHLNASSNLFQVSLKNVGGGLGLGVFANFKTFLTVDLPTNLVKVAVEGNGGDNLGIPLVDKLSVRGMGYLEIGLNLNKSFLNGDLKVGTNLKYLSSGLFVDMGKDGVNTTIYTDKDTYDISVAYENYRAAGLLAANAKGDDYPIIGSASGLAVDIGAVYDLKKVTGQPLKVAMSLLDISTGISFSDADVSSAENSSKDNTVPAIDNTIFEGGGKNILDRLLPANVENTKETVKMQIPLKWLASVQYDLGKNSSFYLTNYAVFDPIRTDNVITLAYSRYMAKGRVNVTGNISKRTNQSINFGLGTSLMFLGMQFFVATDNVGALLNVSEAQYVNVNVGLNIAFGSAKKSLKIEKASKGNLESLEEN